MTGLDVSRLAPSDAVVALRSLPRRFADLLRPPLADDRPADADDLAHRIGPDGHSAIDRAQHVVRTLSLLDRAVDQVIHTSDPVLHPAVADDHARWVEPDSSGHAPEPDDVVADLAEVAERLAYRAEGVVATDWIRTGQVARDGGTVTAIDLLRAAVADSVGQLHAARRTMAALRGR